MPSVTDDDDILAAEFALGLLDPAEAEAVQVRAREDAVLSLRIAWWRDQLAPLAREAEVPAPEGIWNRIEAGIGANDNVPGTAGLWKWATAGFGALAALLLAVIVLRPAPLPVAPPPNLQADPLVATLADPKTRAVVSVSFDRTSGRVTVSPAALDVGRGDAELWIIPADGVPRSLGVIDAERPARHTVDKAHRDLIGVGGTFAISIEPKGGSRKDGPTGPVVVTGKITSV